MSTLPPPGPGLLWDIMNIERNGMLLIGKSYKLKHKMEPTKDIGKYEVAVSTKGDIVDHLPKGKTGNCQNYILLSEVRDVVYLQSKSDRENN